MRSDYPDEVVVNSLTQRVSKFTTYTAESGSLRDALRLKFPKMSDFIDAMEDLENLRTKLDKNLTLFHFIKAKNLAKKGIAMSRQKKIKSLEYYFKAQLFIAEDKFSRALRYLNLSLMAKPQDGFSLNDKGICLAELGELDEALAYFNKAIRIMPDYPGFYQNKGWLFSLYGEYKKALIYFFKALELNEQRPDTLFSIGYCFEKINEVKKAKQYYLRALTLVRGKSNFALVQIKGALARL